MSKQQNRLFRYGRLAFVALAFVLYPYFVNQMPALGSLLKDVPPVVVVVGALVFAAIVVVGPELLNPEEVSAEELWQQFWKNNQEIIRERLKNTLDQNRHIDVASVDSPEDLERPQPKKIETTGSENLQSTSWVQKAASWIKGVKDRKIVSNSIWATLPRIEARRELQNLQTQETTPVAASQPILEIFEEANRRLLILGEPGSGKTTELLKLAQALGEKAKNDPEQPVPVIFELSVWRGEPMLERMAEELAARYGLKLELCREWLQKDKIVPLLDGLDELGKYNDGIKQAILAIDDLQEHYQQQQPALVICCRIADYESIEDEEKGRIRLRKMDRAVRLCKLEDKQIQEYLAQRGATHLWQELPTQPGFQKLAKNPMLLNLMPIAYPEGFPQDAPPDPVACQGRLFEDFLARKLHPPRRVISQPLEGYEPKKTRHYLVWLAASMGRVEINQREFLIEKLQPVWLETEQQWKEYRLIAQLIAQLIVGLIFGPIYGLIYGPIYGLIYGPIYGLIVGLIFGPIFSCSNEIELTEALDLSWRGFQRGLYNGLIGGLIGGLSFGLMGVLTGGLIAQLSFGLSFGLIVGLIFGLVSGLIGGLRADLKVRNHPNQGIWETGIKTLMTMGLAIPLTSLIYIVPKWAMGQAVNLVEAGIWGVGTGVFLGFFLGGGVALVQHFALRWVLFRRGQMPWNYAKFLTEAAEAGILKQSGGRFRFYHDKLREHFAQELQFSAISIPKFQINGFVYFELLVALILLPSNIDSFSANRLKNIGMQPFLQAQDTVLIDKITYRFRSFQRGDIIWFNLKKSTDVKYIVAEPHETIEIKSGDIWVDGKKLKIENLQLPEDFTQPEITLTSNEYYAVVSDPEYQGDYTGQVVRRQDIRGQVVFRFYPLNRAGVIR